MVTIQRVRPILTAPEGINLVIVRVETSDPGLTGVGCATFTQRAKAVATAVTDYLDPLLRGREVARIEDIWHVASVSAYWRNGPVLNNALSGVDMALWDIKGKQAGMPVYDLLGGRCREAAAVYQHASGATLSELEESVRRFQDAGTRFIRCQLGPYGGSGHKIVKPAGAVDGAYYDPVQYAEALPQVFEHLRSVFGWSLEFLHDVHERLAPVDAIRLAKSLEQFRLFFLEDVIQPEQYRWLEQLRAQCATPIALGELFNHPLEWDALISRRLIDFIRVHVSQIGGITPGRKLATYCERFGVRTAWHGPGDTSPVGHAANLHLDLSSRNFGIQEWHEFNEAAREVFPGTPEVVDGYLYPSGGPGLGIDIDEEVARRFPPHDRLPTWTEARHPDGTSWTP
jgi:mannonate dehydratase